MITALVIVCPKCDRECPSVSALESHLRRAHQVIGRERANILSDVMGPGEPISRDAIRRYDEMHRQPEPALQTP